MAHDLDTPEGRYAASQVMTTDEYNAAMKRHAVSQFVEVVNGYGLRWVSTRFGRLCQIYGEGTAFNTVGEARVHAKGLEKGPYG